MNLRRFLAVTRAQIKITLRNRIALFWSFAFPIILMTMLGLLFGGNPSAGTITVVDRTGGQGTALIHALENNDALTVKIESDADDAVKRVRDGDREAALVLTRGPDGVNAHLSYSNASAEQSGIIRGIVSGAADNLSIAATGQPPAIAFSQASVESDSLDYIDFLLPGIIAIAIMTSGVFGLSTVLVDWRKRGILRRLKLTPMPLGEFLASRVAASMTFTLAQLVVLIGFGYVAFGVTITGSAWAAVPIALAGALAFLALGFLIGSLVASPDTADAVSNAITFPMMFLSGTFFPVGALPPVMAAIAKVLPLYYLASGLRDVTVRGFSAVEVLPQMGALLLMAAILGGVSTRFFRWEPND